MRHCVKWPQIKICQHDVTSSESSCLLRLQCTQNICPVMFCRSPSLPLFPDSDSKLLPFMDRLPQKGLRKWECKIKTSSWVPSLTVDLPSQGGGQGGCISRSLLSCSLLKSLLTVAERFKRLSLSVLPGGVIRDRHRRGETEWWRRAWRCFNQHWTKTLWACVSHCAPDC